MKVIIKIGNEPNKKILSYTPEFWDDFDFEIKSMQKLLLSETDITILDATQYLIYTANSMILNSIIQKNKDLPNDLKNAPKIDPKNIKIIEVDSGGYEKCIQDENGMIRENYFNKLMGKVMDDYYEALSYYDE